jgi:hypothetical protein
MRRVPPAKTNIVFVTFKFYLKFFINLFAIKLAKLKVFN